MTWTEPDSILFCFSETQHTFQSHSCSPYPYNFSTLYSEAKAKTTWRACERNTSWGAVVLGCLPHQEVHHLSRITFWQGRWLAVTAGQDRIFLLTFFSQDPRFTLISDFVAGLECTGPSGPSSHSSALLPFLPAADALEGNRHGACLVTTGSYPVPAGCLTPW